MHWGLQEGKNRPDVRHVFEIGDKFRDSVNLRQWQYPFAKVVIFAGDLHLRERIVWTA